MMSVDMRAKRAIGSAIGSLNPQCRYGRCLFVLGHMRCGSTALSNILCSRPEVSGYGEAHIAYSDRSALGMLTLNQLRRRSWRAEARYLFDKVLHSRYDQAPTAGYFDARAIFVVRAPDLTIRSIRNLFDAIGSSEYPDDSAAARYYCERVEHLTTLWRRFPPARRLGLQSEALFADPDAALATVSRFLGFDPPLENAYVGRAASVARGAGDPLRSAAHGRIEVQPHVHRVLDPPLAIDAALHDRAIAAHARLLAAFAEPSTQDAA